MKCSETVLRIVVAAAMMALAACGIGKPMDFPEPQSELTSRPGAFTGDSGEWVIYRKP